jgi:predicted O-linked N-acetylglucosamine transferase (SPINDLY family)
MLEIRKRIENDKDGISKLNEHTDWNSLANANIYDASFDLLISGNYHIYYGELNPMKCTRCLKIVCKSSLTWALDNHIITQENFDEQMKCLRVGISLAG